MSRLSLFVLLGTASGQKSELFKAIDADNAAMVNVVLKSGKSGMANIAGPDGEMPLMYATKKGKHRAFKVRFDMQISGSCCTASPILTTTLTRNPI